MGTDGAGAHQHWGLLWWFLPCLSVQGEGCWSGERSADLAFGWLGLGCRLGSELWARMCLVLDKFRCLIDFIRALEGSEGKIS